MSVSAQPWQIESTRLAVMLTGTCFNRGGTTSRQWTIVATLYKRSPLPL